MILGPISRTLLYSPPTELISNSWDSNKFIRAMAGYGNLVAKTREKISPGSYLKIG